MSELSLTINGQNYTVACEDGQEEHLGRLSEYVKMRVEELAESIGQIGDARLILMVSLLISDELSDAYAEIANLRDAGEETDINAGGDGAGPLLGDGAGPLLGDGVDTGSARRDEDALASTLEDMAKRIEAIAQRLEDA